MSTLVANSPPPLPTIHNNLYTGGNRTPQSPAYSPKTQISALSVDTSLHATADEPKTPHTLPDATIHAPIPISFCSKDIDTSLRPAKDVASFLSLLPPAVEFVEGSSTGTFASELEGRYEPINGSPKMATSASISNEARPKTPQTPVKKAAKAASTILHSDPIDLSWPPNYRRGAGLINIGNTCFLNSALQCLLHTPPLLRMLISHKKTDCRSKSFCMSCAMGEVMQGSFGKGRAFSPTPVTRNLNLIAKHLRRGRQEDAHEFLRYAIDSLQKSCLAGYPPKLDPKIAETSWVHRIFGGRLRSRVTCHVCGNHSDTYDSILDLSLDIYNMQSVKDALKKFTAKDYLKGADKYKCEKCKKPVNAEKSFTVHEAPRVLTVHLKRFTPMGRKLQNPIRYDERLNLQPAMSEGQYGPVYTLYGVISHMGGGPNSGHYFAHVRGSDGIWYEMNDDAVERAQKPEPFNMKNAYILFYIREKGQELEAALNAPLSNGKKRKNSSDDTENDEAGANGSSAKVARPFIGPVIPANLKPTSGVTGPVKPRKSLTEETLRRKIEDIEKSKSQSSGVHRADAPRKLEPLVDYADDSDSEEQGERIDRDSLAKYENKASSVNGVPSSSTTPSTSSSSSTEEQIPETPIAPPQTSSPVPSPTPGPSIAPAQFYGTSLRKRKPDHNVQNDDESSSSQEFGRKSLRTPVNTTNKKHSQFSTQKKRHSFGGIGSNPYGKGRLNDNIDEKRNAREERELFRPRKLLTKKFGRRAGI